MKKPSLGRNVSTHFVADCRLVALASTTESPVAQLQSIWTSNQKILGFSSKPPTGVTN